MRRLGLLAALALAGCGPSDQFDALGVGLTRDGGLSAEPLVKCLPGLGDCPEQMCFHATFEVVGQLQTADGCTHREDVHSGHLYRPVLSAPEPVSVGGRGVVDVKITSGGEGEQSAAVPVVPNE